MIEIAARCFIVVKVAGLLRGQGRSQVIGDCYLVVNAAHAFDGAGYLFRATSQACGINRAGERRSTFADRCFDVGGREFRVVQDLLAYFCLHGRVLDGSWCSYG